ncbi:MAG: (2Fe-2S)-binding protein [Hyphomicrobiales bacterium]|nr:(2Fe-2S)-binding protein [Hyphomicrobiales bacterium]
MSEAPRGQVVRVKRRHAPLVVIEIDGEQVEAFAGESVLVAVLAHRPALRHLEFSGEPRAGFCLMGACQDCWVEIEGVGGARACTTPVSAGLRVSTGWPRFG